MIYSQVVWALALDRIIWHVNINLWTLIGVGSVVCSLILVSLAKEARTNCMKDGVQYESSFTDCGTENIGLEVPCASENLDQGESACDINTTDSCRRRSTSGDDI